MRYQVKRVKGQRPAVIFSAKEPAAEVLDLNPTKLAGHRNVH
jgi:hypothetical protein